MVVPEYPVAAKQLSTLAKLGELKPIGGRAPTECIVLIPWRSGHGDDKLQVWVNVRYLGYRDAYRDAWFKAWQECGVSLKDSDKAFVIEPGYDVDHLFPRSSAIAHGYDWIRVFPIHQHYNRSWRDAVGTSSAFPDPYLVDRTIWNKWTMRQRL